MNRLLTTLGLGLATSGALAQACFDANSGTNLGGGDDIVLPMQSIGFAFPFAGSTYTDIHVCTNGFLYLSNAGVPAPGGALCCTGTVTGLVAGSPKICALWNDLNVIVANGAAVRVNSSASACIVTWDDVVEFGNTVQFDLQAQLFPTGEIKFTYGGNTAIRTAGDCLVGVSPGNGAPVPAASNFSVAGITAADTCLELFNNAGLAFDLAGRSLALVPTGIQWGYASTDCLASTSAYGTGCVRVPDSFYEYFATSASHDLSGTGMTMVNTGTGYVAAAGSAAYVPPGGGATSLALGDDSQTTVALSSPMPVAGGLTPSLTICSNGFVSVASGNGTGITPNIAAFLAMSRTVFSCWHDYNPAAAGSGQVKFEEAAGIAYVTWDGVFDFGQTSGGSTFQFQFDLASGNVDYVWVANSGLGNAHLIGFSVGGPSFDPGMVDLSVALPTTIAIGNTQIVPLALAAVGQPRLGATVDLTTSNIPPGTPFGAVLLGLVQFNPGIDLTWAGMAGCFRYTDGAETLLFVAPPAIRTMPFHVPNQSSFLGLTLFAQSATYSPGLTPANVVAANGVRIWVGP